MRKALLIAAVPIAMLAAAPLMAQSAMPDMTQFGYPQLLARVFLQPGQAATIVVSDRSPVSATSGTLSVSIPATEFTVPVQFDLLANSNSYWDSMAPNGTSVVANFAYRVTDLSTGQLIDKFKVPLAISIIDPGVSKDSVYWATTANGTPKLIDANQASFISGDDLEHAQGIASVGWIVTTPSAQVASLK